MSQVDFKGASPNAHFLVGEMPAPSQLKRSGWGGTSVSIAVHALVLGALLYAATHVNQIVETAKAANENINFIFLETPKPGLGAGGGGAPKDPTPPRKIELKAEKPVSVQPIPKPADIPTPPVTVAVQTPTAVQTLPGTLNPLDAVVGATGAGGGGKGNGIGEGTGPGVGKGEGGGIGGGPFQPGNGINNPILIKEVKPAYTGDAMRAKLQGVVEMDAIVLPDGSVDPKSLRITRSLDANLGLDEQAKIAVRQWRFRPGTCARPNGCNGIGFGQPVPVQVTVELTFTLR